MTNSFTYNIVGPVSNTAAESAIKQLLEQIGEDVTREGLRETPARVFKALREMTDGYQLDPAEILATQFTETCDEIVLVREINFVSLCEHHMLPFSGIATVGYLPGERIVGLSKIPRLVACFAHRLQVQERLTTQIAQSLMDHLGARGAGCIIKAHHSCMSCRGVRSNAHMVTSSMLGAFRDQSSTRSEFLTLAALHF